MHRKSNCLTTFDLILLLSNSKDIPQERPHHPGTVTYQQSLARMNVEAVFLPAGEGVKYANFSIICSKSQAAFLSWMPG